MPAPTKRKPSIRRTLRPEHFAPAMRAARAQFVADNIYGVFGFAIAQRRYRGRQLRGRTLCVFVQRKDDRPAAPIPDLTFQYRRQKIVVRPDVVATGRLPTASLGQDVPYSGLHVGAALRADNEWGGIACFLGDGRGPTHLVTAGHLFAVGATATKVWAALRSSDQPTWIGTLALNLLELVAAERQDVAVVKLNAAGVAMMRKTTALRAPRLRSAPLAAAAVSLSDLKVYLPRTGDYAPAPDASDLPYICTINAAPRGDYVVENVIVTDYANNAPGDSGTVLMTDEPAQGDLTLGSAVGVLIGRNGAKSLHEPLDRAITTIKKRLGATLRIYQAP